MSLTGLGGIVYLIIHLVGNTVVYEGPTTFNGYAGSLHAVPFLPLLEAALALLFAVHIALGVILTYQNWTARPIEYEMLANHGGKTAGVHHDDLHGPDDPGLHGLSRLVHAGRARRADAGVAYRVQSDLSNSVYACCYAAD